MNLKHQPPQAQHPAPQARKKANKAPRMVGVFGAMSAAMATGRLDFRDLPGFRGLSQFRM